jgi:CRISPR-associated endonuclease/helicase Cas3
VPVVIALTDCIARPPKAGQEPFWLVPHLEAVAAGAGRADGSAEERLAFLAGLAHDAAKAAPDWQAYIRSNGRIQRGPPHAPLGAALFAFWADRLIPRWEPNRRLQEPLHDLALDWVRMIYRHHGALDDLDDLPPWQEASLAAVHEPATLLATCDRDGLDGLIRKHFPEYDGRLADFERWLSGFDRTWRRRQEVGRIDLVRQVPEGQRHAFALRLADLGGRLIYADRRHAAEWEPDCFPREAAEGAILRHTETCRRESQRARESGADEKLIRAREERQAEALHRYRENAEHRIFTLFLPTGYGKTLTGLRVALEAVRSGRCRRLVYVAPYISILSQSAGVIQEATGLPVFVHHHLSILGMKDKPKEDQQGEDHPLSGRRGRFAGVEDKPKEDQQGEDHQSYDLLDTWQAPIVATTFNQLFRALFPARAQECLRIPALENAFVFIDEPQIVDPGVWCAFLRALAVAAGQRGCQVLFSTATLPPLEDGLGASVQPVPLVGAVLPAVSRYAIRFDPTPCNAARLANEARRRRASAGSVAVILNTVRDAVETFQLVRSQGEPGWFFLAAMMLPGHKARLIRQIRCRLDPKEHRDENTGVVGTQVLEAGVDFSFRSLLRALPIFSSVAQAAGRANRHNEGEPAEVLVFPFVRDDGKDSARFVYRDESMTANTVRALLEHPYLPEERLPGVLAEYYRRCWEQNPHTTSLQWFDDAAAGKWSVLSGKEPFGADCPRVAVFVPGAERWLSREQGTLLGDFRTTTAEEVLGRYLDRDFRHRLSLPDRKRLTALLRLFTVAVPRRRAEEGLSGPIPGCDWLWRLSDPNAYSDETGLAHHLTLADEAEGGLAII